MKEIDPGHILKICGPYLLPKTQPRRKRNLMIEQINPEQIPTNYYDELDITTMALLITKYEGLESLLNYSPKTYMCACLGKKHDRNLCPCAQANKLYLHREELATSITHLNLISLILKSKSIEQIPQ